MGKLDQAAPQCYSEGGGGVPVRANLWPQPAAEARMAARESKLEISCWT